MIQFIKNYILPISMTLGLIFHSFFSQLAFLTPYLIFCMLLITYSQLSVKKISFELLHFYLLAIQVGGSIILYYMVQPYNLIVAQAMLICVLAPTAASSVVVTKMLGGNIESLTSYNLLSNLTVAIVAPLIFSITATQSLNFTSSFIAISIQIIPLLVFPFVLALIIQKIGGVSLSFFIEMQKYSLYIWSVALMIVCGKIVMFILAESASSYQLLLLIAILSLFICLFQFAVGRKLGSQHNNTVAGGQALGQKNTILAIWMTQTYLNPSAAIGPGAYVLWQNLVNSYQLWRSIRKK